MKLLLAALCSALLTIPAIAEPGTQSERRMEKSVGGQQLSYWLYSPKHGEGTDVSLPLILFLHGSGERGDDMETVKVHGPPKLVGSGSPIDGAIVISPQCPADMRWRPDTLKALLDEVLALHPEADTSRLYVTGLSMGGYGTWGMLAEFPDLFAAAVPICGGGDITRLPKHKDAKSPIPFSIDKLRLAKDVPIWAYHGDKDGAVPAAESQLLVDGLIEAGAKSVRLTLYEGVGHDSWTRTYDDPEVWKWLFEQRKP